MEEVYHFLSILSLLFKWLYKVLIENFKISKYK